VSVVGHDEWLEARKQLLAKEKEFTRARDELTRQRQALPWEPVENDYVFDGPNGNEALADLFDGRSQLIVSTSCSPRRTMSAARAARSGPTTSIRT